MVGNVMDRFPFVLCFEAGTLISNWSSTEVFNWNWKHICRFREYLSGYMPLGDISWVSCSPICQYGRRRKIVVYGLSVWLLYITNMYLNDLLLNVILAVKVSSALGMEESVTGECQWCAKRPSFRLASLNIENSRFNNLPMSQSKVDWIGSFGRKRRYFQFQVSNGLQ